MKPARLTLILVASLFVGPAWAVDVVIDNVTLISPERDRPVRHAHVLLQDGRIAEISTRAISDRQARRIDGTGRFLIPGLIDSHVHVGHSAALDEHAIRAHPELWAAYRAQVPRAYLAFGFTSVVDLNLTDRDKTWFESTPMHPRLYGCGRAVTVAGGYGAFEVPPPSSPDFPNLVYDAAEASHWPESLNPADYTASRAVKRAQEAGAICVKAFVESGFGMFHFPYLHTATLRDIRTTAAAAGLPLIVHANGVDSWRSAVDAHADVIAHGLWIWPGDLAKPTPPKSVRDIIAAAARNGVFVQPTLQTVAGERSMFDRALLHDERINLALPPAVVAYLGSAEGTEERKRLLKQYRMASPPPGFEALLSVAIERTHVTFRTMLKDHVRMMFGSDTPAGDGFGNPPGLNGRLELQDWEENGAALSQILRAATIENARALRLSDEIGSIEVGKRADLLLLTKNPLRTIAAYDTIETIFLGGEPIARAALRP